MLCQRCQQRPATVFFSHTVGNETTQAHLCEVCAKEQGQAYGGLNPFNLNPFAALSEFMNNFNPWEGSFAGPREGAAGAAPEPQLQCPHCGYQLSTFRQNGRLGCTQCYDSFRSVLEPLINGIHGNVRHIEEANEGPRDGVARAGDLQALPAEAQVKALRKKLREAVKGERYEEAARIRDEIKRTGNG